MGQGRSLSPTHAVSDLREQIADTTANARPHLDLIELQGFNLVRSFSNRQQPVSFRVAAMVVRSVVAVCG